MLVNHKICLIVAVFKCRQQEKYFIVMLKVDKTTKTWGKDFIFFEALFFILQAGFWLLAKCWALTTVKIDSLAIIWFASLGLDSCLLAVRIHKDANVLNLIIELHLELRLEQSKHKHLKTLSLNDVKLKLPWKLIKLVCKILARAGRFWNRIDSHRSPKVSSTVH